MTDFFKDVNIRRYSMGDNLWVIESCNCGLFLLTDGTLNNSVRDANGALVGVYFSYADAKILLEKYKPSPTISEIKPGEKFFLSDARTFGEEEIVYTCIEPRDINASILDTRNYVYFVNTANWKFGRTCKRDRSKITYVE